MEGKRGQESKRRFVPTMDCVFGVVGNGFAVVAGGAPAVAGGGVMLNLLDGEKDRAVRFNSRTPLGASGRAGDW
ncbi:hypothetical protein E2562_036743 [Oryza meyeriana var. granulata]|uniref:Uncharacterized protein n=1 Tax=Oryza meyeriana var. granulata TaxID=110450 RepID=A0A6G1DST7_9ORYZ|nr:hypothetical protein E2562_036743 [Oryza meyeriana var. granulata]